VLPRGSLKSTTAALIALHHVLSVPDASVYVGAGNKAQASVIGTIVRQFAAHERIRGLLTLRHDSVRIGDRRGPTVLTIVASDGAGAHGWLHPTLLIADEVWSWSDREPTLMGAMATSLVKNPACKLLVISTAAASLDSPLGRLRERALAQPEVHRKGAFLDAHGDGLRWLEWSLPDDADPADYAAVASCNPMRTADDMRQQHKRVTELEWLQFHCCRWGVGRARWLPVGAWQARRDDYEVGDTEPLTLGVDVGGSRSATALVTVTNDLRVGPLAVLQGAEAVLDAVDWIRELARTRPVRQIVFDPMRFSSEALRLSRELRLTMIEWPQSETRMTICSENLHRVIVEGRLRQPGDRQLDLHVANAEAKPTPRGWRLVKRSDGAQIDAVIALAMAAECAEKHQERSSRVF
jgi:phage terminase large subunit-like protein